MKRSEAIKLIANQLDFINELFTGGRTDFTEQELINADVILTTLESAGMLPPSLGYKPATKLVDGRWIPQLGGGCAINEWEDAA